MGRQIALIASPADEQLFLSFLRSRGPVQLCVRDECVVVDGKVLFRAGRVS